MQAPNFQFSVFTGPDDVAPFWDWLTRPGRDFIAADVETTGLDIFEPGWHTRMIQFGDTESGWAIPFQGWQGLVQGVFDWSSKFRVEMNWWNLNYDAGALAQDGIKIDYEVQTDSYVLAGLGGHADQTRELKPSAVREFGQWAGAGQSQLKEGMKNAGWDWATVPFGWKPYPMYGILDTCLTAMLRRHWQKRYDDNREMHDMEIETIRLCNKMVRKGLPTDRHYLQTSADSYALEEDRLTGLMIAKYGIKPSQGAEVARILKDAGVYPDDAPLTDGGQPSTAAAVLSRIDHQVARAVLRYRRVHNTRVRYLEGLLKYGYGDRLVHCNIQPMQAKTGRMSISSPALQQLPGSEEPVDNVAVRSAVIAHDPDKEVVLTLDFSQIELRIWAHIYKETPLVEAIRSADQTKLDFFTTLCRGIYHEPDFQKSDHRRTRVKSSTYAKMFAGGIETAARTAGVSVADMIPTWHLLGNTFPSMREAGLDPMVIHKDGNGAYADSPFNRHFSVSAKSEIRKLPNYLVQGSAAIALKKAVIAVDACGLGDYLMLPVHDELLSSVPITEADEIREEMSLAMGSVICEEKGWAIGVPVEGGYGPTWATAKG